MPDAAAVPPLSLYVHLPWCVQKCPYCDFNSHALSGALPAAQYMDALLRDLEYSLPADNRRPIISVFFGGGTPSLFPAAQIERFLDRLGTRGCLATDAEITLEANPGTVERHSFKGFAAAGINRVSIGAQSFDAAQLAALGRIHNPDDTRVAVAEVRAAGIDNFNLDLMFGLPGQSSEACLEDLQQALALQPAHLSAYQLTIEPNTAFHKHPPALRDEDSAWEMQIEAQAVLQAHGFAQYEVSAYSQPGRSCRHNINYWQYGDYLGIGAGAHQKLTGTDGNIVRLRRRAHPGRYMRAAGTPDCIAESRTVSPAERVFEFMLNVLRLRQGFHRALFETRTGLQWRELAPRLELARERGLLVQRSDSWLTSELGWRFLNDLQALFLPEGQAA